MKKGTLHPIDRGSSRFASGFLSPPSSLDIGDDGALMMMAVAPALARALGIVKV